MLRNYLLVALRNLRRHKAYSFINVTGLAVGIASCVLILLFVQNELSFDRHHEYADSVYRVGLDAAVAGQEVRGPSTPTPMARTLVELYPEVISSARIESGGRVLLDVGDREFYEEKFFWADSTVFDIFSYAFVQGDPSTALTRPNTTVLTEEMARKYFGDEDPMGKSIRFDQRIDYEITGVMQALSSNSHLNMDFIASFVTLPTANNDDWMNNSILTYVRLEEGIDGSVLSDKFPGLVETYAVPLIEQALGQSYETAMEAGLRWGYYLDRMSEIYLHGESGTSADRSGDIRYVYTLSAIAAFILLIACMNFMNLSTARATGRAKEVGLRKVLGSDRRQLIRQFLGESIFMATIALVVALGLTVISLPGFRSLTGVDLTLSADILLGMVGIAILTGLLAGIYPALVLSSFRPVTVLKGTLAGGAGRSWMRRVLVVSQFSISITLVIGTAVVFKQLRYMDNKELGFNKEHVVVLPVAIDLSIESAETFRSELMQHSGIHQVAVSSAVPGPGHLHQANGFRGEGKRDEEVILAHNVEVTYDYVETLQLELVAGRNFSREYTTDLEGWVVNEAAVRELGWDPETAVGKEVTFLGGGEDGADRKGSILGVFRDAHFASLHEPVRPIIMGASPQNFRYIPVRIQPGKVNEVLDYLEARWASFDPVHPFEYFFLDEEYGLFYEQEQRLGKIYSYFTVLAILIACLGLFGLASYVTQQRTKEIGVRKALGASISGVVVLLSKEFTWLVLVASLVASPISYFVMNGWLQNFAFSTEIGIGVFVAAALMALSIAWLTVGYQAFKAAVADPVKALRCE